MEKATGWRLKSEGPKDTIASPEGGTSLSLMMKNPEDEDWSQNIIRAIQREIQACKIIANPDGVTRLKKKIQINDYLCLSPEEVTNTED